MPKRARKSSSSAALQAITRTRQVSTRAKSKECIEALEEIRDSSLIDVGLSDNNVSAHERPRKKAKTSASGGHTSTSPQPASNGEEQTEVKEEMSLSLLPTMPHDILYEVLGHSHPKDLISLSRTSRQLREILLCNSAVWQRARERLDGPDCPSYTSEREWAVLLFVNICQMCGKSDVNAIDFLIRRRLCFKCREKNLINSSQFEKHFPGVPRQVLDIVPDTISEYPMFNLSLYTTHYDNPQKYYLKLDIKVQLSKLEGYERRAKRSVKSGQADSLLDKFKEYHKAKIRLMHLTAPSYLSWRHTAFLNHKDGNA